jgi:lipoprotein NlpD
LFFSEKLMQHKILISICIATLLNACSTPMDPAPVEERTGGRYGAGRTRATANPSLPGAENSGKPGYHTVRPGDTIIRIALESGQNWKDVIKWNNLENPNVIEVGQVLRVIPPEAEVAVEIAGETATTKAVNTAKLEPRPLEAKPASGAADATAIAVQAVPASAPASGALVMIPAATPPMNPPPAREGDDNVNWRWPANGALLKPFEEGRSKGLTLNGKAGDPVVAAADGRVVYAGSGLRGYGNLVILKHNSTYLTAYAHNQRLLVKEDQMVRRGQEIAQMGSTDAEQVQLHFEVRRLGKPIDPAKVLPPR